MKKFTILMLASALAVGSVWAGGFLYTDSVMVTNGGTSAQSVFTIGSKTGDDISFVDRFVAVNVSGNGTGTVSFAAYDLGVTVPVAVSGALTQGNAYTNWPRAVFHDPAATSTNADPDFVAEPYSVRKCILSVSQEAVTNDTVYKFGVYYTK